MNNCTATVLQQGLQLKQQHDQQKQQQNPEQKRNGWLDAKRCDARQALWWRKGIHSSRSSEQLHCNCTATGCALSRDRIHIKL